MASSRIVHIIDDDDALRDSLAFLLASAGIETKTYESAADFLAEAASLTGGCIVTDVRMPDLSGIDMLRRLRAQGNTMPVIVMTGHGDVPMAVEAMKIGASDFFEKPFEDTALLDAVRSCIAQQQGDAERTALRGRILERIATLTNREQQVLRGLVAGKPNKIIAFDHGISPRTVEIYRANVMTKMEAATLSDLVKMAMLAGILDDDPAQSEDPGAGRAG
jgi:two-component system response regulator FixJ